MDIVTNEQRLEQTEKVETHEVICLMTARSPRCHHISSGESQAEHDDLEQTCAMQRRGGPGSNQGNNRVVEQT